jgi:UDP-4-amino-4-deoxy-L-arabinose-oxoglutarate aminotransferase
MARLGTKANLPDLLAALLPPQIDTIQKRLARRAELAARYTDALAGLPLRRPILRPGAVSAHHIFPIHVPPAIRDEAIAAFNAAGVAVTVNYRAVPTLGYYRERYGYGPADFPVSYAWGEGTITLPFFPAMKAADQDHVVGVLREHIAPLCGRAA